MSAYSPNKKYETINYYGGKFRDVCGAYTGYGYCYISENGLIIKGYFRQGYCKYGEITYPNDVIIKGSIGHNTRESSIIDILFIRYDKPFEIRIDYDKSTNKNNNYKSVSYNVDSDEYDDDDSEEDDDIDDPSDDDSDDDDNSDISSNNSEEDKKDNDNITTTKNSLDIVSMKQKYIVTKAEIKNVVYYSPDEKIRLHGDNIIYVDEKCSIKRGTFINNQFVKGDILYKNGFIASGEFNEHERLIGEGVFIQNRTINTGIFNNGLLYGNGTIKTTYGELRNGTFCSNILHGKGIHILRGDIYEGTFVRGYLDEGKITFTNHNVHEGKFVRNQLIKGKKTTNKYICNGEYNDKCYLIKGRMYNKYTGFIYEGDFKEHRLYGQGKVWRNKKLIKEGEFYADVLATGVIYKYNSNGTFNTYDTTGKLIQDNSDPTQYIMQQKIDILFDFVDQLQMQNQHLQQQIDDLQHYINDT